MIMDELKKMREVLEKIAQLAKEASTHIDTNTAGSDGEQKSDKAPSETTIGCSIKALPARLRKKSAENAIKINPVNAPAFNALTAEAGFSISDPQSLTILTSKYWGASPRRLSVSFMETTPADLRAHIVSHMNAWTRSECISFVETNGIGQVRISRGAGGYWSYLGTDILLIPSNRPTMNLQGFSMATAESEFKRVVRHETGHTLGFPHEHMRKELVARIDPAKAYDYFRRTQGWDRAMVDAQVLTALDDRTILGTPPDQTSIMCYQLPGAITRDGKPIVGGVDINATDYAYAGLIYPRIGFNITTEQHSVVSDESAKDEWSYADDVRDDQIEENAQATLLKFNGAAAAF